MLCQNLGISAGETLLVIKQAHGKEALSHSLCVSGTNVLHRGETVWKMVIKPVGQKRREQNSRLKTLIRWQMNRK
jgi:hypothetical protein